MTWALKFLAQFKSTDVLTNKTVLLKQIANFLDEEYQQKGF